MTDAPQQNPSEEALSFEQALARLEEIAAELESGDLGLAASLAEYEEGVTHLRRCHELLRSAERKIELLTGIDSKGRPVVQPFEEEAGDSLVAKAAARSTRRGVQKTKKKRRKKMTARPSNATDPEDVDVDEPRGLF